MAKIIVEVCQNHKGSRETLGEMIKVAAENGADFVKMQSIWSEDVTKRERFEEGVTNPDGTVAAIKRPYAAEVERLSKLDLSLDDHLYFIETCQKYAVQPLTTIFARRRIPSTGALPWPGRWVKVASYDCASWPMLEELAQHFDNFIISTGATYDSEIQRTAELMLRLKKNFIFLHCVTSYPNTLEMCNLSRMQWLKQFTPVVGWSDHSKIEDNGIVAAKAALMLGAEYVERHFTILEAHETKDGPISLTPRLLRELSDFRKCSQEEQKAYFADKQDVLTRLLGSPTRNMTPMELLNRDYYRGRFASKVNGMWVYNWEDKPAHANS